VPFELIVVALGKGEHKSPAYLEKQPFGQIPVLDDDGFLIFESRAICRYIATKYADQGTKLIPTDSDLKARALFEQAASIEQSNFEAFAGPAVYENLFKKWTGEDPDPVIFDALIQKLDAKLEGYDKILSKQKYLAGNVRFILCMEMQPALLGPDLLLDEGTDLGGPFPPPAW
ncbi:hypothetical protein H0H93_012222, partial [Arthromyces matolae]